MSARFGQWASTDESDLRFSCDSISHQPGSFYNGNFSSSIWGSDPPPAWKATPPLFCGAYSDKHGRALGLSSSDKPKLKPITSPKIDLNNQKRAYMSSSEQPVGKQDLTSSPFSFGFPAPTSAPLFSGTCSNNVQSEPNVSHSKLFVKNAEMNEGRTDFGTRILLPQRNGECFPVEKVSLPENLSNSSLGLFGSVNGLSTHLLGGHGAVARDGQQPRDPVTGSSVADIRTNQKSVQDRYCAEQSGSGPDLVPAPSIFDMNNDVGAFVFGSSSASETDAGLSKQRGLSSASSGCRGTLPYFNSKGRKHYSIVKQRSGLASSNRASQPGPAKCNTDGSLSGNYCLNFTVGLGHVSNSQYQERDLKGDISNSSVDCDPDSNQSRSISQPVATNVGHDGGLQTTFDARKTQSCESQHAAQAFDNAGHLLPTRQENLLKDGILTGVLSDRSMPYLSSFARKLEGREARNRGVSREKLHKVSIGNKEMFEGPKLTEFDLNSSSKLSAEDIREKASKGGNKLVEEITAQKENLEPKFSFGDHGGFRPFVFGSTRPPYVCKHTGSPTDDITKNKLSLGGTKDEVFEDSVSKLGEKLESLEKIDDVLRVVGNKSSSSFEISLNKSGTDWETERKSTYLPQDSEHIPLKNNTLDHFINGFHDQLKKKDNLECEDEAMKDEADATQGNMNGAALQHAMSALHEQISKLGLFDDKRQKPTAISPTSKTEHRDVNNDSSILPAIEELTKQIAQLNTTMKNKIENDQSSIRLQESKMFKQSVEELLDRIKTLGLVSKRECTQSQVSNEKNGVHSAFVFTSCPTTTQKNRESARLNRPRVLASKNKYDKAKVKPLTNVPCTISNNEPHCPGSFPATNPCTGQPSTVNPFVQRRAPVANPFAPRQPTPGNLFTAGQQFTGAEGISRNQTQFSSSFPMANPFAAGQSSMTNPFAPRPTSIATPFAAREPSVANPFTVRAAGQPSSIPGPFVGTKVFHFGSPFAENSANPGFSIGDFEFKGINSQLKESTKVRKSHRKSSNSTSGRSSHSTSVCQSPGSPMDFSPHVDKSAPSSKASVFGNVQEEFIQTFSVPESEKLESINVEEILIGTSNLTVGNDRVCKSSEKASRPSDSSSDGVNPFLLRQKKGTWRRAPRKGKNCFVFLENLGPQGQNVCQMTDGASCGTNIMEGLENNIVQNTSSGFCIDEVAKTPETIVMENRASPIMLGKMDNNRKVFPLATSTTKEQMCEKWRLRGNQAYAKGDYVKAEDCYTRGVSSFLLEDTSEGCLRASMLCYSNRAATRMAVGRMRDALTDCKQAMMLDSGFLRARLRAASCHLALGESKFAAALFADCLRLAKDDSRFDPKVLEEAKDGVRKSQSFDQSLEKALMLIQRKNHTDTLTALQLLNEALTVGPLSEATQDLRAQALFSLRRYEEVVQFCQKTLSAAEENHGAHQVVGSHGKSSVFLKLWRWCMAGKALLQLGRLDESLSLLTKYEDTACGLLSADKVVNMESMTQTITLIRDLLCHKAAGNKAFQDGRHTEALEHYTAALSCSSESRPFIAVCFCNRAAASQALGHIADAIADCSRAIVLDSSYAKAISRRATLHEIIRDFGQSLNDLTKLISLLERQESFSKSHKTARTSSKAAQDLKQARDRIEKVTAELKKQCMVDHYLILGLDAYCSSGDIKKAYRKAALKHHPDKAGQLLVQGEHQDNGGLWKEVGDEVRRDAERLFKIIGEAYATLSDPSKRAQFDYENEKWKASGSTGNCNEADHSSPSEKTGHGRHERNGARSDRSPRYQRWQNGPDAAQPDMHSETGPHDWSKSKDRRHKGRRSDYQ